MMDIRKIPATCCTGRPHNSQHNSQHTCYNKRFLLQSRQVGNTVLAYLYQAVGRLHVLKTRVRTVDYNAGSDC